MRGEEKPRGPSGWPETRDLTFTQNNNSPPVSVVAFPGAPLPGHRAECPAHERSLGLRLAVSTAGNGRPPEPQSAARAGRNSDGSQRGGVCAGKASAGAAG